MAFESTPENTDAIGAMIVGQTRPLEENSTAKGSFAIALAAVCLLVDWDTLL